MKISCELSKFGFEPTAFILDVFLVLGYHLASIGQTSVIILSNACGEPNEHDQMDSWKSISLAIGRSLVQIQVTLNSVDDGRPNHGNCRETQRKKKIFWTSTFCQFHFCQFCQFLFSFFHIFVLLQSIHMGTLVDNISVDPDTGEVYVACPASLAAKMNQESRDKGIGQVRSRGIGMQYKFTRFRNKRGMCCMYP